jgi:hypothetical protein
MSQQLRRLEADRDRLLLRKRTIESDLIDLNHARSKALAGILARGLPRSESIQATQEESVRFGELTGPLKEELKQIDAEIAELKPRLRESKEATASIERPALLAILTALLDDLREIKQLLREKL